MFGLPNIASYYSQIAQNLTEGKTLMARKQFEQLSQKQRKAYFMHIHEEWKASAGDAIYDYFFDIL